VRGKVMKQSCEALNGGGSDYQNEKELANREFSGGLTAVTFPYCPAPSRGRGTVRASGVTTAAFLAEAPRTP